MGLFSFPPSGAVVADCSVAAGSGIPVVCAQTIPVGDLSPGSGALAQPRITASSTSVHGRIDFTWRFVPRQW